MTKSTSAPVRGLRRVSIIVAIVSLSLAALIGIVMILSGDWDTIHWRVLGTTAIIGAFSILVLADLTIASRRLAWVGWLGVAAALIAAMSVLLVLWEVLEDRDGDVFRIFAMATVVAIALAVASLLLLLADRRNTAVRVVLPLTLALIGIASVMLLLTVATDGDIPGENGDAYWRFFAVAMILAVLGAVVLPVLGLTTRKDESALVPAPAPGTLPLELPADLAARIAADAAASGRTPQQLVEEILRERLG